MAFEVRLRHCTMLREDGFEGPAVSHYVWDRGAVSVMDRLMRKANVKYAIEKDVPWRHINGSDSRNSNRKKHFSRVGDIKCSIANAETA